MILEEPVIHHTNVGTFIERDGAYIAQTISPSQFVVPAAFSVNGQTLTISLPENTVVITPATGATIRMSMESRNRDEMRLIKKSTALLSSWLGADNNTRVYAADSRTMRASDFVLRMASENIHRGPYHYMAQTTKNVNLAPLIQLEPEANGREVLNTMAGLPASSTLLNIPEPLLQASVVAVTAHELAHSEDDQYSPHYGHNYSISLFAEIVADHSSLRRYFNNDVRQLVMDLRALGALNLATHEDASHLTHIWDEEYTSGTMPTNAEASDIVFAPKRIQDRINQHISSTRGNDFSRDMLTVEPVHMLSILQILHERKAFDDIPFANEFIDKYISAAERLYQPAELESFGFDMYKVAMADILDNPERREQYEQLAVATQQSPRP